MKFINNVFWRSLTWPSECVAPLLLNNLHSNWHPCRHTCLLGLLVVDSHIPGSQVYGFNYPIFSLFLMFICPYTRNICATLEMNLCIPSKLSAIFTVSSAYIRLFKRLPLIRIPSFSSSSARFIISPNKCRKTRETARSPVSTLAES